MDFRLTPEQEKWRDEVREFLRENMTEELQAALDGGELSLAVNQHPAVMAFRDKVVEKGWFGLNWPKEYGGLEKSSTEQLILMEEFDRVGAPNLSLTLTSLGPTIIRFGTEENKRTWLPKIIRGEAEFALGYSEPDSGTDLASLQTRAVLDGDEWVINGQKIWNSGGHVCTHEWLAVRTDPDAPKHKGISVIIVPIDSPGIEVQPLWTWGDVRTNQTFFTDVRVPKENLIGELNRGWYYIAAALDFERVAIGAFHGAMLKAFDALVDYCKRTSIDGRVLVSRPEVRSKLAVLARDLELAKLFGDRTAAIIDSGLVPNREASQQKVFTTELQTKFADLGTQLQELHGQLDRSDDHAPIHGVMEHLYRKAPFLRFGGGTNEIQRNIVAQRGLGLPRA
jgi:alkylation response protein AidB-like acyl-CoA dehydrogenase